MVYGVDWQEEVLREEHVAHNGVNVDEHESEDKGEQDGGEIAGDTASHILERVIALQDVKQL